MATHIELLKQHRILQAERSREHDELLEEIRDLKTENYNYRRENLRMNCEIGQTNYQFRCYTDQINSLRRQLHVAKGGDR